MRRWLSGIFGKSEEAQDYSVLRTDIHSHLIPGIDDGAKDTGESLQLLGSLQELGFSRAITTPHVMSDFYRNTRETILTGCDRLREEAVKRGISIEIEAAAEYYIDEQFTRLLKEKELLVFGKKYLLFEISYINPPVNLMEIIFDIQVQGYIPVMAHPERYIFWSDRREQYNRLKEAGVLFMVNTNSFAGYYGKEAVSVACWLADNKLIDLLGSDVHHQRHIRALRHALKQKKLVQLLHQPLLNKTL